MGCVIWFYEALVLNARAQENVIDLLVLADGNIVTTIRTGFGKNFTRRKDTSEHVTHMNFLSSLLS